MIGLDTNVLIRWLTADDPHAHALAARLIAEAGDDGLYVGPIVLIELFWVLTRTYKMSRIDTLAAVETLLDMREFVFANRSLALEAVRMAQQNGYDLADALIGGINREAGCVTTITFDHKAGSLASMTRVEDYLS